MLMMMYDADDGDDDTDFGSMLILFLITDARQRSGDRAPGQL